MKLGINKGCKNFKNKLTEDEVKFIYMSKDKISQNELAKRYNVSQSTINHIIHKRTWSWFTKNLI